MKEREKEKLKNKFHIFVVNWRIWRQNTLFPMKWKRARSKGRPCASLKNFNITRNYNVKFLSRMHTKTCDTGTRSMPTWDSIYLRRQVHSSIGKNVFVKPGEGANIRLPMSILKALYSEIRTRAQVSVRTFIYGQIWIYIQVETVIECLFFNKLLF